MSSKLTFILVAVMVTATALTTVPFLLLQSTISTVLDIYNIPDGAVYSYGSTVKVVAVLKEGTPTLAAGDPVPGRTIVFRIYHEGILLDTKYAVTDEYGEATVYFTLSYCDTGFTYLHGEYKILASFEGDSVYSPSADEVTINVKVPPYVFFRWRPKGSALWRITGEVPLGSTIQLGARVKEKGSCKAFPLAYPLVKVYIYMSRDKKTWAKIATLTPRSDGWCFHEVALNELGTYYFSVGVDSTSDLVDTLNAKYDVDLLTVSVTKNPTQITVLAPSTVEVGQEYTVKVVLTSSGQPLASKPVELHRTVLGSTVIYKTTTNSKGEATFKFMENSSTVVEYRAHFPGDDTYSESWSKVINVTAVKTPVLFLSAPEEWPVHRELKLILLFKYGGAPVKGRQIEFYRSTDGETWAKLGANTTNSMGEAVYTVVESMQGKYYYKAVFPGDTEFNKTESNVVEVTFTIPYNSYITVDAPEKVYVGEEFTVKVRLMGEDKKPIPHMRIHVYRSKDGLSWTELREIESDTWGWGEAKFREDEPGTVYYKFRFGGGRVKITFLWSTTLKFYLETENTTTLTVVIKPTLELSAPTTVNVSESFTLKAKMWYADNRPLAGKTVYFYRSTDGENWQLLGASTTDVWGEAEYVTAEADPGTYYYKAVFTGDPETEPAESEVLKITVLAPGEEKPPEEKEAPPPTREEACPRTWAWWLVLILLLISAFLTTYRKSLFWLGVTVLLLFLLLYLSCIKHLLTYSLAILGLALLIASQYTKPKPKKKKRKK